MDTSKNFSIEIKGLTPFVMHSDLGCNPLDPLTKKRKEISCIKKKTDEHYIALARIEWEQSLYYTPELGVYLPSKCIYACLKYAARKFKQGKDAKAITTTDILGSSLVGYEKASPPKLWDLKNKDGYQLHVHCASVVVQRARIMRTWPIFNDWATTFRINLDTEILTVDQLKRILKTAGFEYGVGDMRPQLGGSYGKFTIEKMEEV